MPRRAKLLLALLAAALAWQAWQRLFVSEEARVKAVLSAAARAVETGDVLRLGEALAPDYSDDRGLDKASLVGAARGLRERYAELAIELRGLTVTIDSDGQKAQAVLEVRSLGRPFEGSPQTEIFADRCRLSLRKDAGGWRVVRAETPKLDSD